MRQVKGSILISIVKGIKANHQKRGEYDAILSSRAKELLQKRILPGTWYSFEDYRECFDAVCFVEARNDPETIIGWGRREGKLTFKSIYHSTVFNGDLQLAAEKYTRFHRKIFSFGEILTEVISNKEVRYIYTNLPRDWKNWYYTALGWAQAFIELCIDKKVNYTFLTKSWVNGEWTKIKFSWGL
ncbi:MAG: hypothetical protein ACFFDH_04395 [Promethearchaeota archaeon]